MMHVLPPSIPRHPERLSRRPRRNPVTRVLRRLSFRSGSSLATAAIAATLRTAMDR